MTSWATDCLREDKDSLHPGEGTHLIMAMVGDFGYWHSCKGAAPKMNSRFFIAGTRFPPSYSYSQSTVAHDRLSNMECAGRAQWRRRFGFTMR